MRQLNPSSGRKSSVPDQDQLVLLIRQFVEAETWPESKRILLRHPELLSDEAEEVLAGLIASQSTLQGVQLLVQVSDLLARCRSEGVDVAFAPLMEDSATTASALEVPSEFEPEVQRLAELIGQARRDPQAYRDLVALIKGMLRRLQKGQWTMFRTALLSQLGTTYKDAPTGDRETNLAQAIACYQEALTLYTLETTPLEYAATQVDLGNAYVSLPQARIQLDLSSADVSPRVDYVAENRKPTFRRGKSNLEQAIECYKEALRVFTPETAPHEYAETQINLGSTYLELSTDPAILKRAQACFEEGLRWLDREADPARYTLAQTNLRALRSRLRNAPRHSTR
jgi:tetratricopeptide (TPR) repeat protein